MDSRLNDKKMVSSVLRYFWEKLPTAELLKIRLCDLKLSFRDSPINPLIENLYQELKQKGLFFKPHIWISDEWFSPDGVPGFSIPFFVVHERLMELEKEFMSKVEGGNPKACMKLLRHETAHALDNAFFLRKKKLRQQIFGLTSTPYPETYEPIPFSKNYVIHLEDRYAQAHPDEDWAETFAVWLDPDSDWKIKYQNWSCLKKLEYVDKVMAELLGGKTFMKNRDQLAPINEMEITLETYYKEKITKYKPKRVFDGDLLKIFADTSNKQVSAVSFLRNSRRNITLKVASHTGQHQYAINDILKGFIKRCAELDLKMTQTERQTHQKLVKILTSRTTNYLKDGIRRVCL